MDQLDRCAASPTFTTIDGDGTSLARWTFPRDASTEDIRVALDDAGWAVNGRYDGPGRCFAHPIRIMRGRVHTVATQLAGLDV